MVLAMLMAITDDGKRHFERFHAHLTLFLIDREQATFFGYIGIAAALVFCSKLTSLFH
jgi:hypothetical protein